MEEETQCHLLITVFMHKHMHTHSQICAHSHANKYLYTTHIQIDTQTHINTINNNFHRNDKNITGMILNVTETLWKKVVSVVKSTCYSSSGPSLVLSFDVRCLTYNLLHLCVQRYQHSPLYFVGTAIYIHICIFT